MKKFFSKILAYCCFAVIWITSLLPMWVHYLFSDVIYFFLYRLTGYRRGIVRQNLQTAFPEKPIAEVQQIERDFYHWFCDYLVETIKLMTISEDEMRRRMTFRGTEAIDRLVGEGISCGVMLGHYCNWEWISTLPLAVSEKAVCAELYHPIENPDFDRLFLYIRQRFGSVCIPMEETLRHIVRYQREDRPLVIGYIADQKPNWRNIHLWTEFLGHTTPVFTGSERIIKRTRQAFFYGDVRRVRRGYYECEFKLIEQHSEQLADYQLTERYMQLLEQTIRREPALWLWSHDRWSRTKEEFDYRFYVKDGKVYEKVTEEEYARHMGWRSYWHH
jgi:KDO2-lipid IV(A) lauroyltransferase